MSSQDSQLNRPVPDWLLEQLARGELPPERAAELRRRLEAEGEAGAARLAALEASNRDILAANPPAVVAAEIRRRAALPVPRAALPASGGWWRFTLPTLALGAAGMLVFALGQRGTGDAGGGLATGEESPEVIGIKGPQRLAVHLKRGNKPLRLPAGSAVQAGDQLQLSYVAGGKRFGVVASVDARGTVTLHLPETPGQAASLVPGKETRLPHAFELDDSPGAERFVFVAGDRPFSTDVVAEALRPGGPALPGELTLVDLTLQRKPRQSGDDKDKP